MIVFGTKIVTVYNRHFDALTEEETWFPTVLSNVNLVVTRGANITKSGLENADSAKLYVDEICSSKQYLLAKEWHSLTLDKKEEAFTFTEGEDFFVEGNTSAVSVLAEGFFEYMQKHYDNVFRVTTVDAFNDVMKHLEIGGK